jgi:predicted porin
MKKSLLALAVLGAYAGVASAQSSVTIFGIVDLSINQIKNGDQKTTSMQSNQLNSSRLGFRGYEDLGGGLGAGFHLESAINAQDNTATLSTARKSTVSLFSARGGELRLGRDYTPTFSVVGAFDVYGANGLGQDANLISGISSPASVAGGAGTGVRANNSIGYHLPGNLGGFYGNAMYALGQGNDNNKYWGLRGGFAAGPFDVALGYGETELEQTAILPESAKLKLFNLGGSWNFGFMKLYGLWNETKIESLKESFFDIGVSVPLGQGEFKFSYADVSDKGTFNGVSIDNSDATQWALQYIYNLSKRTALYGGYAEIDNDPCSSRSILNGTIGSNASGATGPGGAAFVQSAQVGVCSAAATNGLAGKKSNGFNVGVRHMF